MSARWPAGKTGRGRLPRLPRSPSRPGGGPPGPLVANHGGGTKRKRPENRFRNNLRNRSVEEERKSLPTKLSEAIRLAGHPMPGTVSRPSDQGHLGPFPWMLPPWSCPGTPWTPTPPVPTGTSCSSPVGNFAPRSTLPAPSWRILLAPREGLRARRTPPVLVGTSWPAPRWEPAAPRRTARSLGPASSA